MIDSELMNRFDLITGDNLKQAIRFIHSCGMWQMLKQLEFERLAPGSPEESDDQLAERIRAFRYRQVFYDSMIAYGNKLKEQNND